MTMPRMLADGMLSARQGSRRIDKHSPVPLYVQLEALLWEQIRTGEWKPNDRLPSEEELAREHGVSKITVRQALRDLAAAGWLRREQGRGTFVAEPRLEQGPRDLTSFSEEMRRRGMRPSSRVLEKEVVAAGSSVAEKLQLAESTPVFRLSRLRLADDTPMGLQTAYLPACLVPDIIEEDLAAGSLYEILERKYGLTPRRAREIHQARLLDREEARYLSAPEGAPALAAERLSYLADGTPLELVYSVMRGDRYQIVLELVRGPADRSFPGQFGSDQT